MIYILDNYSHTVTSLIAEVSPEPGHYRVLNMAIV